MGKRSLISGFRLPPGFRFHPTDEELVMYYLKRKVMGRKIHHPEAISEVDIYNYAPWELPPKSCLGTGDRKWYFFCPSEKKYSSGGRMKRSTDLGYWKATGKDRAVYYNKEVVGMIKTLVFHRGKAPKGERTDWVMYEYRLQEKRLTDRGVAQDVYVLCVIFKKDGPGPKNGAQYGAPFKEEDWDDDDDQEEDVMMEEKNAGEAAVSTDLSSPVFVLPNNPSISEVVEERNGSEVGVSTSLYAPAYVQPVNQRIPEVVCQRNGSEYTSSTVLSANLCVSKVVEKMKGGEDISSGVPVLQMQINPSSPDSTLISSHVSCQPNTLPSADMNVLMVSDNDGTTAEAPLAAHDDGDIFAMLDAFSVDHNVSHEVSNLHDGVTKADSSLDGIDISTDLGDLRNLSGFDELTNNMFSCYGNDEYLELRDLTVPLNFPTEVARHEHVQAGDLGVSNNYYSNF